MVFATVQEVRDQTTFGEVSSLSDEKVSFYIERANSYLRRKTGMNYRDATDIDLLSDLRRATVLLVEYFWYLDQPEVKESNMAGINTERMGSYNYNKGTKEGSTGNPELDELLANLRGSVDLNMFFATGPSRVKAVPYDPHAYVTDIEE